ncbi:integrase, catalytic region, zinc finger, CCHC-type containing protein, partial [Tanacetum coccineum]
ASSVRRPLNRDSPLKNSVLSNTKKSSEKIEVSVRTNKKTYIASKNVVSNKKIVTDIDVENALKGKEVLCVSCAKNVLIPCHDKCLANYKLNVHSKVKRALFTTPSTAKSAFVDTTLHMTGDRSLLKNFAENFMGTFRFGNDHFAAITGYGDYVQGNITVCHVYYVEGLGHNLFNVEQFCDSDLEVTFRSNTCYMRNLEGDALLTRAHESILYSISIFDMAASSPVCLMSKVTSTKSWLWHRRFSHLNFGTIKDLTKHDLVDGLPKFTYGKYHLCSVCERGKSKKASHPPKVVPSWNCYIWIYAYQCRYNKTPYELLYGRKPTVEYFHVFGSLCYPTNDRDDLGKMKPKADIGIFIGYSETSRGFRIYNRRTKKIMETIHVKFDELTSMASEHDSLEPIFQRFINDDSSPESMNIPTKEDLDNLFRPMYEEYFEKKSSEMSINSAAQQVHNHEDSPSTSSIIVEEHQAPPIV